MNSKEISMSFKKVDRSYRTPQGYRLATFQEVEDNLESIKQQHGLLEGRDRARLLDGWISGPDYNFEMENTFRGYMGFMLVIEVCTEVDSSFGDSGKELYEGVNLTEEGKQVALLLCAYDWNYEVVYWLLNSWDKTQTMDPGDVRDGRIPVNDPVVKETVQLNTLINDLARKYGETFVNDNENLTQSSVRELLCELATSVLEKFPIADKDFLKRTFQMCIPFYDEDGYWFKALESHRDSRWNLIWDHFCTNHLLFSTYRSLSIVINKLLKEEGPQVTTSQRNFILSNSILYYVSRLPLYFLSERETGTHDILEKFITITCNENFNVLDQIVHVAASKGDVIVTKKMLECGAHVLSQDLEKQIALHVAFVSIVKEGNIDVVKKLLDKCDAKEQLANATGEEGKTALHLASSKGNAEMCRLLIRYGAKPDAKDNRGRQPLHYAVEGQMDEAIEVVKLLLDSCDAKEQLLISQDALYLAASQGNVEMCRLLLRYGAKPDAKDNRGRLPLHYAVERKGNVSRQESIELLNSIDSEGKSLWDIAVDQNNIKLMAQFFTIFEQSSESYFNKMDTSKLLRQFASEGYTDIVAKLLERGASPLDVDEEGKTALHHAAVCKDESQARNIIDLILEKCQDKKKLISMCDKKGKTAVHVAAFNGIPLMQFKDSIDVRDRDGRSPLYDAIQGKSDVYMINQIIHLMKEKGISLDNLMDTSGLTPLHMAASQGKVFQVNELLKRSKHPKKYVKRADYLGQTALHKAAKGGHVDTIKVLLYWGAQPLLERDCDGRTALHHAVQTKTGEDGAALAKFLLERCGSKERQLLFLWASAAGLGTADQNLGDCPLKTFLLDKKEELGKERKNLLQTAARVGDTEMTKELLTRGYQIEDIRDEEWRKDFEPKVKQNVEKVLKEIQMFTEQGNDQPSLFDNLGRADFARGLALLLLNPYVKPPIAIGISGNWGMGKSSLMLQTEIMLLKTAAQSALLPTFKSPSSNLSGVKEFKLSKVGKKRYNEIKSWIRALTKRKSKESQGKQPEDSLDKFLNNYEREYHRIFKSLAAIDSSDMFVPKNQQSHPRSDSPSEGSIPAIITVQYNAWKYRNESEALAGMAVEITKEIEEIMTDSQWLSTSWRNTWRKQKQRIWFGVIFPCLLAIFLAGTFTWIVWLLLDRYNVKEGIKLKYASLPVTVIIIIWTLVKSAMSVLIPVSTQLMNYINFPDHTDKLGYQDRVIADITFLKEEIRKKPCFLCSVASCIWHLITRCCMISYLCRKFFGENMVNSTAASTPTSYASDNPRIIVFVDDLDRCQESVILQVLSAINLVFAVCEISAIVCMDKALIQGAIIKEYGDRCLQNNKEFEDKSLQNNKELADKSLQNIKELADKYLQKIIQLPLDLPDPNEDEYKNFLKRQLGVFSKLHKDEDGEPEIDVELKSRIDTDYYDLLSTFDDDDEIKGLEGRRKEMFSENTSTSGHVEVVTHVIDQVVPDTPNGNGGNVPVRNIALRALWNALHSRCIESARFTFGNLCNSGESSAVETDVLQSCGGSSAVGTDVLQRSTESSADAGGQSSSESIPIREMLFVRYSEGEQDAFCYFQKMATDWRKLPRHWKCLFYYHRLVWYIFSMSNEARNLDGWQVQLITWIFLCWEWEENINILVQNWDRIGILKTYKSEPESGSGSTEPSLRAIVEHYIENEDKVKEMSDAGDDKHEAKVSEKSESKEIKAEKPKEDLKEKDVYKNSIEEMNGEKSKEDLKGKGISKNTEDPESSNRGQLEAVDEGEIGTMSDSQGGVFKRSEEGDTPKLLEYSKNKETASEKMEGGMKEKHISNNVVVGDESSGRVVDKLEKFVNRAISEKLDDIMKTLRREIQLELDEVTKEIRNLKEMKQQAGENKNEEEITRRNNWQRMKAALKRYDVSMKGIQAFQRFRFYCVAGHLPWPLPKKETEDS